MLFEDPFASFEALSRELPPPSNTKPRLNRSIDMKILSLHVKKTHTTKSNKHLKKKSKNPHKYFHRFVKKKTQKKIIIIKRKTLGRGNPPWDSKGGRSSLPRKPKSRSADRCNEMVSHSSLAMGLMRVTLFGL